MELEWGSGILTGSFLLGVRCPSDLEGDVTSHSPLTYLCLGLEISSWDARNCRAGCILRKSIQPRRLKPSCRFPRCGTVSTQRKGRLFLTHSEMLCGLQVGLLIKQNVLTCYIQTLSALF